MCGSRVFFQEEGPGPTARRQSGQCFFFFSPQPILQFTERVQWFYYRENYTFPRIQRGSNIFQGGGGPNANFSQVIYGSASFLVEKIV